VIRANARFAPPIAALFAVAAAALPASACAAPVPTTVQAAQQAVAANVPAEVPAPTAQEAVEQISTAPARTAAVAVVPRRFVQRARTAPKRVLRTVAKKNVAAPVTALADHALRAPTAEDVRSVPAGAPDRSPARGRTPRAPHLRSVLDRLATGMTVLPSFPARAIDAHRADRMVARGFAVVGKGGGATSAARPAQLESIRSDSAPTDLPDLIATSNALPSPGAAAGGVLALLVFFWLVLPRFIHAPGAWMPMARLLRLSFALELPG